MAWTDDSGGGGSGVTILTAYTGPTSHTVAVHYNLGDALRVVCRADGRPVRGQPVCPPARPPRVRGAELFDPGRRQRQPDIPRSSFIPFGSGVHKCIGDAFAITESTIALATIGRRWHLRLAPESKPLKSQTEMTLGPASVRLTPIPRAA